VAFEFDDAQSMELAFAGMSDLPTYSRIANPTVQHFEDRVAALAGASSVTALSSGMAAIAAALTAVGYAGGNLVTSRHLFGNTYSLFASTFADFGIETRLCDLTDSQQVARSIDGKTFAVFLEIITNPQMEAADLTALSSVCHAAGVPLIADTTAVPPCAWSGKDFGVDIEVISSTKYISGGATSLGGLILDYASFDWTHSSKLKPFVKSDYASAFTFKMKREIHRNLGAYMTPQAAALQTLGLDTLEMRYQRASRSCLTLARLLTHAAGVVAVNYPGLEQSPYHEICVRQFGDAPCAMLTFDLDSRQHCFEFLNRLKVIKRATNLFDNKTLAIHPESTIFCSFSQADKQLMHISPCTIRLSVGLEDPQVLLSDITQAI
jgi:O-acetylhomoserine (thiol)-lyase